LNINAGSYFTENSPKSFRTGSNISPFLVNEYSICINKFSHKEYGKIMLVGPLKKVKEKS
jgi:hypothetical protein